MRRAAPFSSVRRKRVPSPSDQKAMARPPVGDGVDGLQVAAGGEAVDPPAAGNSAAVQSLGHGAAGAEGKQDAFPGAHAVRLKGEQAAVQCEKAGAQQLAGGVRGHADLHGKPFGHRNGKIGAKTAGQLLRVDGGIVLGSSKLTVSRPGCVHETIHREGEIGQIIGQLDLTFNTDETIVFGIGLVSGQGRGLGGELRPQRPQPGGGTVRRNIQEIQPGESSSTSSSSSMIQLCFWPE